MDDVIRTLPLSDAPSDGNTYGRKNFSWSIVSGGGSGTFVATFIVANWVFDVDHWKLDITHSLGSSDPIVEVRRNNQTIFVDGVITIDANTIRLVVPDDPDLRFDGVISVVAT